VSHLGAEILCFREMIDDDVTLEYDVIDALTSPDELGRRPTHKLRLDVMHTVHNTLAQTFL